MATKIKGINPKQVNKEIRLIKDSSVVINNSDPIPISVFYHIGFFNEFLDYAWEYDFQKRINHFYPQIRFKAEIKTGKNFEAEKEVIEERYNLMFEEGRPKVCAMVCMKNEEEIIEQFLDDLTLYVDFIAVFDDGSTDKSVDLVKKYKKAVAIYSSPPKGNIRTESKDRTKLLQLAQMIESDWILFIDCDECFEDKYKTEIFKEMKNNKVNLWFYHQVNFWRSTTHCRIDTLFDTGWFGRLFRSYPNLEFHNQDEHCGSIPKNIPEAETWFNQNNQQKQKKSGIRVKHYGFSTEERILGKFNGLWERDKVDLKEKIERYERLIDETNLKLKEYFEYNYYDYKRIIEEIIDGNSFGKSKKMEKELRNLRLKYPDSGKKEIIKSKDKINLNPEKKILIVGDGNCFRTQFIQYLLKEKGYIVDSCGLTPTPNIHPVIMDLFNSLKINRENLTTPKLINDKLLDWADFIISLVNLKTEKKLIRWDIPDGNVRDMEGVKSSLKLANEKVEVFL